MEIEDIFKAFCDSLPQDLHITMEQKRSAFDLLYKLCYTFVFRDKEQT